ncbi:hypothetical protein Hanom_Chr03g00215041 [Helianthus anomalus]
MQIKKIQVTSFNTKLKCIFWEFFYILPFIYDKTECLFKLQLNHCLLADCLFKLQLNLDYLFI